METAPVGSGLPFAHCRIARYCPPLAHERPADETFHNPDPFKRAGMPSWPVPKAMFPDQSMCPLRFPEHLRSEIRRAPCAGQKHRPQIHWHRRLCQNGAAKTDRSTVWSHNGLPMSLPDRTACPVPGIQLSGIAAHFSRPATQTSCPFTKKPKRHRQRRKAAAGKKPDQITGRSTNPALPA